MKDYKRWTERAKDGSPALISERVFYEIVKSQGQGRKHYFADNGDVLDIVTRYLAELEDKIENGTLIELPCKKGDDVFAIVNTCAYDNKVIKGTVEGLAYIILDEYGDITFQHISRVSPIKPKQS